MSDTPNNKIFLSARTTQELTLDKRAVATQLQHIVESALYAPATQKQVIEDGNAVYTIDYDLYADVCDTMYTQAIANNKLGKRSAFTALTDARVTGRGNDTAIHFTMNLEQLISSLQQGGKVTGRDENILVPAQHDVPTELMAAFKMTDEGPQIDGQKLLAVLQAAIGPQLKANASLDEKTRMKGEMAATLGLINRFIPSVNIVRNGDNVHMTMPIDGMFETLEKRIPENLQSAVLIRRNEGKATIRIDYNQLVELAVRRAQKALEKKDPSGKTRIDNIDLDTFSLTSSKGGLENVLNGLVDKTAQAIRTQMESAVPEGINIARVSDIPIVRGPGTAG